MTQSSVRTRALFAAVAAMGLTGGGGGAELVPRVFDGPGDPGTNGTPWRRGRGRVGNNRKPGKTFAQKKRIRKIARASRRYNLRAGA